MIYVMEDLQEVLSFSFEIKEYFTLIGCQTTCHSLVNMYLLLRIALILLVIAYLPFFIKSRQGFWKLITLPGIYLRKAVAFLVFLLLLAIMIIISPFIKPRSNMNHVVAFWTDLICPFILGLRIEVEGKENITKELPAVFTPNHQSMMDVFVLAGIVAPNTVGIAKKSLLYVPLFGLYWLLSKNVFIDRKNHQKAIHSIDAAKEKIIKDKLSVIIMPEGTRNKEGGILQFKKGAFHLAIAAKVPIVPVVAEKYGHKIFEPHEYPWSRNTVKVRVLPPIKTEGKTVDELIELTRGQMLKAYTELNEKKKDA